MHRRMFNAVLALATQEYFLPYIEVITNDIKSICKDCGVASYTFNGITYPDILVQHSLNNPSFYLPFEYWERAKQVEKDFKALERNQLIFSTLLEQYYRQYPHYGIPVELHEWSHGVFGQYIIDDWEQSPQPSSKLLNLLKELKLTKELFTHASV